MSRLPKNDDPSSAHNKRMTGEDDANQAAGGTVSLNDNNREMILTMINVNLRGKLQGIFNVVERNTNKQLGKILETQIILNDTQSASKTADAQSLRSIRICMQRNNLCYCYEDPPGVCRPCWDDMNTRARQNQQSETKGEISISSNDKVQIKSFKGDIDRSISEIIRIMIGALQIKLGQPSNIRVTFGDDKTQTNERDQYSKVCMYFPQTDSCYCYEDPPGICRPCEPFENLRLTG